MMDQEVALYQLYAFYAIQAIEDFPDADGITIMQAASGRVHCFPIHLEQNFVKPIISELQDTNDTHIACLIHVWHNHSLDLPAYDIRSALIELHPENKDAKLMLFGEKSFSIVSLEKTFH